MASVLTEEDRGKYLLTVVLGMAHDDDNEENRMVAVRVSYGFWICSTIEGNGHSWLFKYGLGQILESFFEIMGD